MKTARDWKEYYARERETLGLEGLHALLGRAMEVEMPEGGALVFPHTRLEATGDMVAAVALAVVRSGCEEVLALGVLHGARVEDAELVQRARTEGNAEARALFRRVHGPGVAGDAGRWMEEFSLDGFCVLVELAARWLRKTAPRVICRYPFLVGETPEDLPGMEELRENRGTRGGTRGDNRPNALRAWIWGHGGPGSSGRPRVGERSGARRGGGGAGTAEAGRLRGLPRI